ncbi:hypothetical protein RFI_17773, partial [Reticulomyxa filosa]
GERNQSFKVLQKKKKKKKKTICLGAMDEGQCAKVLTNAVAVLHKKQLLVDDLAHGPMKYMGICRYVNDDNDTHVIDKEIPMANANDDLEIPATFKIDVPSFDDTDTFADHADHVSEKEKIFFHRIDLKCVPYADYHAALLYFTGSGEFNRQMRVKAAEKEFILNESGLYRSLDKKDKSKKGELVVIPTCEKDIFDALGMDFVPPEKRSL